MKWEPRPAQDNFLKTDLPPLTEYLRSAGICFPLYNGYELPVKHRLEIPANHNIELDQKNKRRRKEEKSVLNLHPPCARACGESLYPYNPYPCMVKCLYIYTNS